MPNWSNNEVTVTGEPEMVDKIEKLEFDFQHVPDPGKQGGANSRGDQLNSLNNSPLN